MRLHTISASPANRINYKPAMKLRKYPAHRHTDRPRRLSRQWFSTKHLVCRQLGGLPYLTAVTLAIYAGIVNAEPSEGSATTHDYKKNTEIIGLNTNRNGVHKDISKSRQAGKTLLLTASNMPSKTNTSETDINSQSKDNRQASDGDKRNETRLESVSGVSYDGQTLIFTAISNGCTRSEHFEIRHTVSDNQCQISIQRIQPDFCRRAPLPAELSLPWTLPDDCKSMKVVVINPLLLGTNDKTLAPSTTKKIQSGKSPKASNQGHSD